MLPPVTPCLGQKAGLENNAKTTAVSHLCEGEYHSMLTGGSSLNLSSKKGKQTTQYSGYTNCCWEKTVFGYHFRTTPADITTCDLIQKLLMAMSDLGALDRLKPPSLSFSVCLLIY